MRQVSLFRLRRRGGLLLRDVDVDVAAGVLAGQIGEKAGPFGLGAGTELDAVDDDARRRRLIFSNWAGVSFGSSPSVRKKITSGWRRMARRRACSWSVPPSAAIESRNRATRCLFSSVAKASRPDVPLGLKITGRSL